MYMYSQLHISACASHVDLCCPNQDCLPVIYKLQCTRWNYMPMPIISPNRITFLLSITFGPLGEPSILHGPILSKQDCLLANWQIGQLGQPKPGPVLSNQDYLPAIRQLVNQVNLAPSLGLSCPIQDYLPVNHQIGQLGEPSTKPGPILSTT
jgi:hypothetical protein